MEEEGESRKYWPENVKWRKQLGCTGVDYRVILKWT
jgi:hypothetical protein